MQRHESCLQSAREKEKRCEKKRNMKVLYAHRIERELREGEKCSRMYIAH